MQIQIDSSLKTQLKIKFLNEQPGLFIMPKELAEKLRKNGFEKAGFPDQWIGRRSRKRIQFLKELREELSTFKEVGSQVEVSNKKVTKKEDKQPIPTSNKEAQSNDYLDRIVAYMLEHYDQGIRLTKSKIDELKIKFNVPTLGKVWEAVELSWLLHYKRLFREILTWEDCLEAMQLFWDKVQPTYHYSDSSKELYKQYSTPCPIGAIIARYTEMQFAQAIFEPSAGNGLMLVGADPLKCTVNEIDSDRIESLTFQGFKTITNYNAAKPFPKEYDKKFDVVVTNPPFAKWEDEKTDKQLIVQRYFNNHRRLVNNIRLEHVMCRLALETLKDDGYAALIIMGHIYFDKDGFIAKYRPFFNWLYRYYYVDDIINLNSFKLYNKQGAVERTMLILIHGRKPTPWGVAPKKQEQPWLDSIVNSFEELSGRVDLLFEHRLTVSKQEHKRFIPLSSELIIRQLQIANGILQARADAESA